MKWTEFCQTGKDKLINNMYGISIDQKMNNNDFEYLIADNYHPVKEIAEGFVTKVIPEHTWVVFACTGVPSHSLPDVHQTIFSEWLPNCKEYEIAAGYNIEMYNNPAMQSYLQ